MKSFLMRLAKAILQNVLQQLNQVLQSVEEQALNVVKGIISEVVGGAWDSDGARKFTEELSNLSVPSINKLMDGISTFSGNLNKARDIMERADSQARQAVNALQGPFRFL